MAIWLKQVLKDMKIKQKEFAEKVNIHPVRLSNIITERKSPNSGEIERICLELDVSESNIFTPWRV